MTGRHFIGNERDYSLHDQSRDGQSGRSGQQTLRTYDSKDLFAGATEISIEHDGQVYRLKITRQGKLILNK